jgi:hypothetical protein
MFQLEIYFNSVRESLFHGHLSQDQVTGQEAILQAWEKYCWGQDTRWLAYMLATTYHETAQEMMPIKEYGEGAGQPYGETDPETGQAYFGRGFVMLTWKSNYVRADDELFLEDDESCEWQADNALLPWTAARIMFKGMSEGWFRSDEDGPQMLARYFDNIENDPFEAREIINGDKDVVPSWSEDGMNIGELISKYHYAFLTALLESMEDMA